MLAAGRPTHRFSWADGLFSGRRILPSSRATSHSKKTNMPAAESVQAARVNSRNFLIFFLASLAAFGPVVTDFYLPAMPSQVADFGTSAPMVQLGLSSTMWGLAIGQLIIGPISDRRGRRGPLAVSLLVFTAAALLSAAAQSVVVFIALRFLQGLGAAGGIVMSRSIAADRFAGRDFGQFMAVMGAVQGVAPVTAPMIGAFLTETAGWRGIFILIGFIGLVLLAFTCLKLVETRPAEVRGSVRRPLSADLVILAKDPVFVCIFMQQFFASVILFAHIGASPFLFQQHFAVSAEVFGLIFGTLAVALGVGAWFSAKLPRPQLALEAGAFGMLVLSLVIWLTLSRAPLWVVMPLFALFLMSLGLTLPAAMTIALMRHRNRSGSAAALLGAVGFVAGGVAAPLTTLASPVETVPVMFSVSSLMLVLIALFMRAVLAKKPEVMELHDHAGVALDFSKGGGKPES